MQYLLLIVVALMAAAAVFFSLNAFVSDDTDEALSEALLRELSDDIVVAVSVTPTVINPAAVSEARAAEVITGLPEILAGLQDSGVSVADPEFQANVQLSVDELISSGEEPGEIRLEPLSVGLAESIAKEIEAVQTPIARQISQDIPDDQRLELTNSILDDVLSELVKNEVSPEAAAVDEISEIVVRVVDIKTADPEFRDAILDKQLLISDLIDAISGLDATLTEELPSVVADLPPEALNAAAEVVVEEVTNASAPVITERIVEEGLDVDDPEDLERVDAIIDESVAQAVEAALPEGDLQQVEFLTAAVQDEEREAVRDNGESLSDVPTPNDGILWGFLVEGLGAIGTLVTFASIGFGRLGSQNRYPNISVGGVLPPKGPASTPRIHRGPAGPIAFKLAYAGSEDAILEAVEFKAKPDASDLFKDIGFRTLERSARLVNLRIRFRDWVRAQHAQKSADNPYSPSASLEALSLPMVLHTSDQLFISAHALLGGASDTCNGGDDDCPEVDMVSLRLRSNVLPYMFTLDHWEQ